MILFEKNRAQQEGLDFISVSFGYEHELNDFWESCGFKIVRTGSHKGTRTGCHTVMGYITTESGRSASLSGSTKTDEARCTVVTDKLAIGPEKGRR